MASLMVTLDWVVHTYDQDLVRKLELTQIKRHRGEETEGRQKGSLTHGKMTPEIGVNEHEPGIEKPMVAQGPSALFASQSGRQEPDARRAVRGLPLRA